MLMISLIFSHLYTLKLTSVPLILKLPCKVISCFYTIFYLHAFSAILSFWVVIKEQKRKCFRCFPQCRAGNSLPLFFNCYLCNHLLIVFEHFIRYVYLLYSYYCQLMLFTNIVLISYAMLVVIYCLLNGHIRIPTYWHKPHNTGNFMYFWISCWC